MSHPYYYLVASLPSLEFNIPIFLSYTVFLQNCQEQLTQDDFAIVEKATLDTDADAEIANPVLRGWARFNRHLKNEIAYFRALRAEKDPQFYLRGEKAYDPALTDIVLQASKAADPLTAEKILDSFKWQYLNTLVQGHYFDLEVLIVYALKLQILERYKHIELSTTGKEIFKDYKETALKN